MLEELDYEYEAQNHRTFARAYRGHPFIYVPDVITRLSHRRVLVTEWVDGVGFDEVKELPQDEQDRFGEIVFRFCFGSIYHLQHFNADAHPGNYILMDDGRVAFLDFGMTKQLDPDQIELEQRAVDAAIAQATPRSCARRCTTSASSRTRQKLDAERLMEHVKVVGGWYMEDRDVRVSPRRVMKVIESTIRPALRVLRPHAPRERPRRRADGPAHGDRRDGGPRPARGDAQLVPDQARVGVRRPPETELGGEEWDYFESRGVVRTPGIAS